MSEEAAADVVAFITARLDEDEATARAATSGPWAVAEAKTAESGELAILSGGSSVVGSGYEGGGVWDRSDADHIARHNPVRSLREVQVLRQVVFELQVLAGLSLGVGPEVARLLLRKISEIWNDHPGYRTWLPVLAKSRLTKRGGI